MMLIIMGTVRIREGAIEGARSAMAAMLAASRSEDGCLAYSYAHDVLDPGLIHVAERWRDHAALDAHFSSPHMAEWRKSWADLGITDRNLSLYDCGEPQPI